VETLHAEGSTDDDIGLNTGVIFSITTATEASLRRRIAFAILETELDLTVLRSSMRVVIYLCLVRIFSPSLHAFAFIRGHSAQPSDPPSTWQLPSYKHVDWWT